MPATGYSKIAVRNCLCRLVAKMPESSTQADRIVELEMLVTHLQQDLAILNDIVIDQQKQLDALARQLSKLDERRLQLEPLADPRDFEAERPPHY